MVSIHPPISNSSGSFFKRSNYTVTFMFHRFFLVLWQDLNTYRFFRLLWFSLCGPPWWQALFFFFLVIIRAGLLAEIRWSVCILKSQRILRISFFRPDSGLCMYSLVLMVKFQFLAQLPVGHLPCPVMSRLCDSLLHSLIMWLIVSSLSPHNLHLLFCCVLCIFVSTSLTLMVLFCAAIRRDSVSPLKFPLFFFSHIHVFFCEISPVCRLKYLYSCFFFSFLLPSYCCSVYL